MTTHSATPMKPWAKSSGDRVRDFSFFFGSVALAFAAVAATPLAGKLGYAFAFFIIYITLTAGYQLISRGIPAAKDALVKSIVGLGAVLTVLPIASILGTVLKNGLPKKTQVK